MMLRRLVGLPSLPVRGPPEIRILLLTRFTYALMVSSGWRRVKCSELFQFGKGTPSEAHERACVPSAIAGFLLLVGSAVLDEDMLLLAFNASMQYMGVTISMPTSMRIRISALFHYVHGRFAVNILDLADDQVQHDVRVEFSQPHVRVDPHP